MTEFNRTPGKDSIGQSMMTLDYDPDELMVRYVQGAIIQDAEITLLDAKQLVLGAPELLRELVSGDRIVDGLVVEAWFNEARRRQAWLISVSA